MSFGDVRAASSARDLAGRIGRGIVYYLVLQFSVGVAVRTVFGRAVIASDIQAGTFAAAAVVFVLAALLTATVAPSYRQLVVFSAVSIALWWSVDSLVGIGDGHVGALYPALQAALIWLGAFLVAYALTFETRWGRSADATSRPER